MGSIRKHKFPRIAHLDFIRTLKTIREVKSRLNFYSKCVLFRLMSDCNMKICYDIRRLSKEKEVLKRVENCELISAFIITICTVNE